MIEAIDLSLVLPCYNEAPHLEDSVKTILEVLDQTHYEYEIVFVDDQSQDNTRDIIQTICKQESRCRYILHDINRGRGAAFKTGYAATAGAVTGFIDIDLEVHALYIPALVNLIDRHGCDIATGYRHYLLRQTGGIPREILSRIYRAVCKFLLGLGIRDSETGCKFFKRATATAAVMESDADGWFWDTEVMARAKLADLKIVEMPVLFLRRLDKQSTVRIIPDSLDYLRELYRFRGKVGLGLANRSPIYWTTVGYDWVMKCLCGDEYMRSFRDVAVLIAEGSSVVDVCCGTGRLYQTFLKQKGCDYLGLDFNSHFVMAAQNRDISACFFNVLKDDIPVADYVVMTSSFYHFYEDRDYVLNRLRKAARKGVIISEPVTNLSTHHFKPLARLSNWLTNPGVGDFHYRYILDSFRSFGEANGMTKFIFREDACNAIAVFDT